MSASARTDSTLCRALCAYYKPGRNEELACQGYLVVQELVRRGRKLRQERPAPLLSPGAAVRKGLEERVCGRCSFRVQDCDYSATGGAAAACGGFLLLAHLLAAGELVLEDL